MTPSDSQPTLTEIHAAIRNVPDFPKPGIQFKDITPVLSDARLFAGAVAWMTGNYAPGDVDAVAGVDARGFIFASAAALRLQAGLVLVRKSGKLPWTTIEERYDLEYGSSALALHTDAVRPGARVLLLDDLLATGGTALAAARLLERLGAHLLEIGFLVELGFLRGRERLRGFRTRSLVVYD
jgi:adenine phosphoribosyltransferase